MNQNDSQETERQTIEAQIESLEAEIAEVKRQWPKHSVPPSLVIRLEDLEEALQEANTALQALNHD